MYKQTMHKIEKSLRRIKRIKIENHFRKFIAKQTNYLYVRKPYTWSGLVRLSMCHKIHKQLLKPSKYIPHQGSKECAHRVNI